MNTKSPVLSACRMLFTGLVLTAASLWAAPPVVTNVSSVDGSYETGDDIYIDITFDQTIFLSGGSPTLELELGENRLASYLGGGDPPSGSTALTFRYTVQDGDFSADLGYTSKYALDFQGAAVTNAGGEQASRVLPDPGTSGSLSANNNITVGEAYLDLTGVQTVEQGGTVQWTVTRYGSTVGSADVFLVSADPSIASVPASVTMAAGESFANFDVTGVSTGGPVTIQAVATGYTFDTRDVTVISADLVLSLQPVEGGTVIEEGDDPVWQVTRSGPTGNSLTVSFSSSDTGVLTVPGTVIIPAGAASAEFVVQALDGAAGGSAVTITATANNFTDGTAPVTVQNVAPDLVVDGAPPASALQGQTITLTFTASDVLGDEPIQGTWTFGDGDTATTQSGVAVTHAYSQAGTFPISLIVNDGDGGTASATYQITITAGFELNVTVLGPSLGLDGVGTGTFSLDPAPNAFNTYEPGTPVTITASPDSGSVFYEWGGDIPETLVDTHGTGPGAPLDITITMDANKTVTLLFSAEQVTGAGDGDLDGDLLWDSWEARWSLDPKDASEPNGTQHNPDGDLLPGVPGYVYPEVPVDSVEGYAPSANHPFHNLYEFMGFDLVRGTADDPGTEPNNPDTDGDSLPDGWEYYFWGNAVNDPTMEGLAYDPTWVETNGVVISNSVILEAFDPTVNNGAADDDPDRDCLTNLEELNLGTDPIHWDTDGDGMPDGWEVSHGLNPLSPDDGALNPDNDWMADDGTNIHHFVYQSIGFDPRTAWYENYLNLQREPVAQPNTREFTSVDEFRVVGYIIARALDDPSLGWPTNIPCVDWDLYATSPNYNDSEDPDGDGTPDGDGMADGWELYVNLLPVGPLAENDALADDDEPDGDGLTALEEFRCEEVATAFPEFPVVDAAWQNKLWPTDPNQQDTDADQIPDGDEGDDTFKYSNGAGAWAQACYVGGGLNPTTADTDGDYLPDYWEYFFPNTAAVGEPRTAMDGTVQDSSGLDNDYDGDGLENYQEYLVNAVYHFQYSEFFSPYWVPDQGLYGYDPNDFFEGNPYHWDWHYWFDEQLELEWHFILAKPRVTEQGEFASCFPNRADTDWDDMDDYYELYHGLNPIFGTLDIVFGPNTLAYVPDGFDARISPWENGSQYVDSDQDGLLNFEESVQVNEPEPQDYHSDPSPVWITDHSYALSWVNLYYWSGSMVWYWDGETEGG